VRVVAAEASAAAPPKQESSKPFVKPALNPDTPSPIFGGSTGGLLRKAQVSRARVLLRERHIKCSEHACRHVSGA
jgi:hypothetical protein